MKGVSLLTVACAAGLCAAPTPSWAQAAPGVASVASAQDLRDEIAQLRREFEARLTALEQRLASVEGRPSPGQAAPSTAAAPPTTPTAEVPPGAQGAGGPQGALPVYGATSLGSKIFNPDIAVIGNFLGTAGHNTVRPSPSFEMREAEASFQAIVDPYARADFFMAFGEEGVDLEEGYVSFPTLPGGLLGRVGKMRAAFGKVNTFHTHQSPWPDRPLVTENLLGGEEGLSDAGVSVARLVPNPWVFLEATGQVFRGDSGEVYSAQEPSDVSYLAHLRGYHDLTESTNFDLGFSASRGHNASGLVDPTDPGGFVTTLYGLDATVRWRPLRRSIYRSFIGRAETVWSRRDQPNGLQQAYGWFVSGDYQFGRRWFTGARFDSSDRSYDASLHDTGQSITLTFWPSEFSQLRGQYRRQRYAEGEVAHEALFQLQFSIGAHGAHPF